MDHADHIAFVEREARALSAALAAGPLDARVPTCPEWSVGDLAAHVGDFTGFWAHILCEATGRPKTGYGEVPLADGPAAVATWYDAIADSLLAELHATPAETPIWTWAPADQTAHFAARRAANELAVHRYDAQSARGAPEPIDATLAADGIEEIFLMIDAWRADNAVNVEPRAGVGAGETLHLHGTDRPDEWLLTLAPDGLDVRREHAKGDLALRGAVGDLELVLYDRPPVGPVERFGDESVLGAWRRAFHFG